MQVDASRGREATTIAELCETRARETRNSEGAEARIQQQARQLLEANEHVDEQQRHVLALRSELLAETTRARDAQQEMQSASLACEARDVQEARHKLVVSRHELELSRVVEEHNLELANAVETIRREATALAVEEMHDMLHSDSGIHKRVTVCPEYLVWKRLPLAEVTIQLSLCYRAVLLLPFTTFNQLSLLQAICGPDSRPGALVPAPVWC